MTAFGGDVGAAENAGPEKAGLENHGLENAELQNDGRNDSKTKINSNAA